MKHILILFIIIAIASCSNNSIKKQDSCNLCNADTSNYTLLNVEKYIYEYDNNNLVKKTRESSIYQSNKLIQITILLYYYTYDQSGELVQCIQYDLINAKKTISNIKKYFKDYHVEIEFNGNDTIGIHKEWFMKKNIIMDYRKRKFTDLFLIDDTTKYIYDSNNRLISSIRIDNANSNYDTTKYIYDLNNHLIKLIITGISDNNYKEFTEIIDSIKNKKTITRKNGLNKIVYNTEITYDNFGNKTIEITEIPDENIDSTIYSNNKAICRKSYQLHGERSRHFNFMKYDSKGNLIEERGFIIYKGYKL